MKKNIKKIIGILFILIFAIISIYFITSINNFGIIPSKYLIIIYIAMALIFGITSLLITRKNIVAYIIGIILAIIFILMKISYTKKI